MKKYFFLFILIVLLLYAVLPLFQKGFIPTHDGEYHIIRFWQFDKMLRSGDLIPRWAPDLNSGYGVPLFIFHYPFPNYVGSLLHVFGLSFVDSFKIAMALGYIGAGILCFLWLAKLFDTRSALVGVVVFSFVPYWFVDIYVRGSIGEVFAIFFLMGALASIESERAILFPLAVAALVLSHNILALLFVGILVGYLYIRKRAYLWKLFLGIGIATYFWLPAFVEKQYVTGLNSVDFHDHFPQLAQLLIPSWGTGFSVAGWPADELSQQLGIIPLSLFGLIMLSLFRNKQLKHRSLLLWFFGVALLSIFLMLELTIPIWNFIPLLAYMQYPWRLLSLVIVLSGFFGAYVAWRHRSLPTAAVLVGGSILLTITYARPVVYPKRDDAYYLSRPNFTDATSSLGNSFTTFWSDWKKDRPLKKIEVVNGDAIASGLTILPLLYTFSVASTTESRIRINTLYYPGWEVFINGKPVLLDYEHDGTITFSVLPGQWHVLVRFTETPLRRFADGVSLFCLFWVIGSGTPILRRFASRRVVKTA